MYRVGQLWGGEYLATNLHSQQHTLVGHSIVPDKLSKFDLVGSGRLCQSPDLLLWQVSVMVSCQFSAMALFSNHKGEDIRTRRMGISCSVATMLWTSD